MSKPTQTAISRAVQYEERLIQRTFESRKDIEMINRYHNGDDLTTILEDLGFNRYKAIEKTFVFAKLCSKMCATLPELETNQGTCAKHLVTREEQIQKTSALYPTYGEAKVREDFDILDGYYAGSSIEDLSKQYKRTTQDLLITGLIIAKSISEIAASKPYPITEHEQVSLVALVNFGKSDKSLATALREHYEFEADSKKATADMIWRDLGVRVSPSDLP